MPRRIYVSCAEADEKDWRGRILNAWAPLVEKFGFEFWDREADEDAGGTVQYHAAVLVVTENYFGDERVQKGELARFAAYGELGRGLFWIPVHDSLYKMTELGQRNILPSWGFQGPDAKPLTVASLAEKQYATVWTEVGEKIAEWWKSKGASLPEELAGPPPVHGAATRPEALPPPLAAAKNDAAVDRTLLPCLIDREPQENPVRDRAVSKRAEDARKIVLLVPSPRDERPDRFADRLSGYTFAKLRQDRKIEDFSVEFHIVAWPGCGEGDDPRAKFEEYLSAVMNSARAAPPAKDAGDRDSWLAAAADALKSRMRTTRFVFFTEIVGRKTEGVAALIAETFAWWGRFVPGAAAPGDMLAPVAVLVLTAGKADAAQPAAALPDHVLAVKALQPIEYEHMVKWLTLAELSGFAKGGTLRGKVEELFPNEDEKYPFAALEPKVMAWLAG